MRVNQLNERPYKRHCFFSRAVSDDSNAYLSPPFPSKPTRRRVRKQKPSKLRPRIILSNSGCSITPNTQRQDHSNPTKRAHAQTRRTTGTSRRHIRANTEPKAPMLRHIETASDIMKTHQTRERETRSRPT